MLFWDDNKINTEKCFSSIFTCLGRVHDCPSCLSIDLDSDRVSLCVAIDCDSSMLTRGDFPTLVDNIWKIDKCLQ
jgi:hypothetical protein